MHQTIHVCPPSPPHAPPASPQLPTPPHLPHQDILSAFKTICSGQNRITRPAVQRLFGAQPDDLAAYMLENMAVVGKVKDGEGDEEVEAYDYAAFVARIFER